ncbi:N-6 DNA methylase [Frankia sp. CNm7]|uniref:site-specific DNA-methyltransferase (adenine-specific) n=1 Tax=Frankia nepalensis TaxID=1836974 RepID=A0A937UP35_9ACTN|nr:DNA methyltransferase [Frankia nepalensis]MBL7496146.1 N-6 DNA methylase [Frankia nepalensis]MBL7508915.1 N-6 DNA methylase [Frankia nepalensis]MBL7516755.1 N-6 DNA methylase [Frankia nepalensis]MBL7628693.1 N-6 DNA methylase [Frankia nepalensis]
MTTPLPSARGARTAGIVGAFTAVRTVGGLLPADALIAVAAGRDLSGLRPADYGLVDKETLREAANRSFTRLQAAWADFRRVVPAGPVLGTETTPTRRWLQVLFTELGYGRLPTAPAGGIAVDGSAGSKSYPVSHLWGKSPIHLLGAGISLDHRTAGVAGAAASAPHSMVQELLNRAPDLLWGFVSNGLRLRLLRDSASLVRQAYVEFDLEAMFDGEVFADFALLWLVAHASRVEPRPDSDARPDTCWLERWRTEGISRGTRALTALRDGVSQALVTLGRGFLRHPDNTALRAALADGTLPSREYYRLLLRVVYQLLVLFVAEDRDLLHPSGATPTARDTYTRFFSTDRLRRLSRRRSGVSGARHHDLWTAHQLVLAGLGDEQGRPELGLPGLGGIYEPELLGPLGAATITNADLLAAVRALSVTRDDSGLPRQVDYRNLGAEELGGIYESLLELVPQYDVASGEFILDVAAGHDRKTTGSYYTPPGLVEILLDEALDPVLDDAEKSGTTAEEREKALLAVTVCDPACGSGHFLAAAARRIARRLAAVRTGEAEPPVAATQTAMRDVVAHCIYGVDLNPMAAELAKVALWLEALDPGRPLSFLDAHVKVGNALIGDSLLDPKLIAAPEAGDPLLDGARVGDKIELVRLALPDEAFTAKVGDDKAQVAHYRKRNRAERKAMENPESSLFALGIHSEWRSAFRQVADLPEDSLAAVHQKKNAWAKAESDGTMLRERLAADAWCATFAWPHRLDPDAVRRSEERVKNKVTPLGPEDLRADPPPPTAETIIRIREDGAAALTREQIKELTELRESHRFFHWPLEFPEILPGGFACVLGNPPWERVKLQDEEFFATRAPEIADAPNAAARKKLIATLPDERPPLWDEYQRALRAADIGSGFGHDSGRYPLTGHGDINTFQLFAEHDLAITARHGRAGVVLPTNIATGDTTAPFFRHLVETSTLAGFLDFENEAKIFSGVTNKFRFAVLCATGGLRLSHTSLAFSTRHLQDLPERRFVLLPDEILLVNPNSGTLPVFRSRTDAEITIGIHRRVPVLVNGDENPWGVSFLRMFDMANDSSHFRTEKQLRQDGWTEEGDAFVRGNERMLPLVEGKMLHLYDHRYATYEAATQAQLNKGTLPRLNDDQHGDPDLVAWPQYWLINSAVHDRLGDRWNREWLLGWRDITTSVNERTVITSVFPAGAVGHTEPIILTDNREFAALHANLSSVVVDYAARQKISGAHLTFGNMEQLPVMPPTAYCVSASWDSAVELRDWIAERVLELSYTSWDMAPYADDLHDDGPPFRWDPERRAQIRAELDAAYLHLYGLNRAEAEHVLDSFFVLRKNEEKAFGTFRTRTLVLAAYDAMATGHFVSPLTPPPGDGPRHTDDGRRRIIAQNRDSSPAAQEEIEVDDLTGALFKPKGTLF